MTRMSGFKPDTYDPSQDSTSGLGNGKEVVLAVQNGEQRLCLSGNTKPVNKGRKFSQGGDAKLKGILVRAHLANKPIRFVGDGDDKVQTAAALAKALGWDGYLTAAEARAKAPKAPRTPRKATASKATAKKAAPAKKAAGRKAAAPRKRAAKASA